jgi:hypothetical protein
VKLLDERFTYEAFRRWEEDFSYSKPHGFEQDWYIPIANRLRRTNTFRQRLRFVIMNDSLEGE